MSKTLVEIDTGADGHDICRYMKRTLQTSLGFLIYDAFFLRPGGGGELMQADLSSVCFASQRCRIMTGSRSSMIPQFVCAI